MGRDSDIDGDYRIINTFNIFDVNIIKTENEKILPYTETSLKVEETNIEPAQLEVDDGRDFLYDMTNTLNVSNMEKKLTILNEHINYENLNAEDDVNTKSVPQLQSKGKERLLGWDHSIVIYLLLISN